MGVQKHHLRGGRAPHPTPHRPLGVTGWDLVLLAVTQSRRRPQCPDARARPPGPTQLPLTWPYSPVRDFSGLSNNCKGGTVCWGAASVLSVPVKDPKRQALFSQGRPHGHQKARRAEGLTTVPRMRVEAAEFPARPLRHQPGPAQRLPAPRSAQELVRPSPPGAAGRAGDSTQGTQTGRGCLAGCTVIRSDSGCRPAALLSLQKGQWVHLGFPGNGGEMHGTLQLQDKGPREGSWAPMPH